MRYKFRAWDKERKEMREVQLMDWSDWWVSTGHTWERDKPAEYGERNSFGNEETDRHILMQWTGLTDRNGKDIYEGDIIVHPELYECPEYSLNGDVDGGHIIFEEGQWRFSLGGSLHEEHFSYDGNMEVIGNIYESGVKHES